MESKVKVTPWVLLAGIGGVGAVLTVALSLDSDLVGASATVLAVVVLLTPVIEYIIVGQSRKRKQIDNYFGPDIIAEYLYQFWAGSEKINKILIDFKESKTNAKNDLREAFSNILDEMFGVKRFIFPLSLVIILCSVTVYFAASSGIALVVGNYDHHFIGGIRLDKVSIAAIFGAYTWIVADAIARDYQRVFHHTDLYWYAMRLVVAVPLGQALAVTQDTTGPNTGAAIAFLVSMFSYQSIKNSVASLAAKFGMNVATGDEKNDVVVKLLGVDQATADKLLNDGITMTCHLASVDPIRLSVRLGLPFDTVLYIVDAAILWGYLNKDLRQCGVRGASNLISQFELMSSCAIVDGQFCAALKQAKLTTEALKAARGNGLTNTQSLEDGLCL